MSDNSNLRRAKHLKRDEFYALLRDIEEQILNHKEYKEHLTDKVIYMNCDNPEHSKFWEFFKEHFEEFKLKKIICTYYIEDSQSYRTEYDGINETKTLLKGDGDFRSNECIEILKNSDVCITNPPFSLLSEFIELLYKYEKKFLIIGNINTLMQNRLFNLITNNKIWVAHPFRNNNAYFMIPEEYNKEKELPGARNKEDEKWLNSIKKDKFCFANLRNNTRWLTNIDIIKTIKLPNLSNKYSDNTYERYDNYDAININRIKDIPCDYYGIMGVPITYFNYHNSNEFKIIDLISPIINEKHLYKRILIQRIPEDNTNGS